MVFFEVYRRTTAPQVKILGNEGENNRLSLNFKEFQRISSQKSDSFSRAPRTKLLFCEGGQPYLGGGYPRSVCVFYLVCKVQPEHEKVLSTNYQIRLFHSQHFALTELHCRRFLCCCHKFCGLYDSYAILCLISFVSCFPDTEVHLFMLHNNERLYINLI